MKFFVKIINRIRRLIPEQIALPLKNTRSEDPYESKPWLRFYDQGVPAELEFPPQNLYELFANAAEEHRSETALIYFGKKITFGRLLQYIDRFARALQEEGVRKGDRVALILPNIPQFLIAYWATLRIGAVVTPLNPLCSSAELEFLIASCRPFVIITFAQLHRRLEGAFERHKGKVVLTSLSEFMPTGPRFFFWFRAAVSRTAAKSLPAGLAFRQMLKSPPAPSPVTVSSDDPAVMLFTGGVTGKPKAVLLLHRNLVANARQTHAWLGMRSGREVIMGVLPFFHSYGMTACHHLAMTTGSALVLEPRFKAARVLRLLQKRQPTIFAGVPTMFRALLDELGSRKVKGRLSCTCVSGGAPLPIELKTAFESATGCRLIEGYGLTEASPITHCNPVNGEDRPGSIGLPLPGTEARIVDVKTRRPVPVGEIGELQVRGPQVMAGYYENAAETAHVLGFDGWLCTGDLAKMDESGFFYIVERKKDLILVGGLNVYPSEVESVINRHPDVEESAVVGIPDDYYGETIRAFVKCRAKKVLDAETILEFCRDKLAAYKLPRSVVFVDALPKNFVGKVVRRKLAGEAKNRHKS
ncbi:MAG: long-chain fatty acid--CoA ligase [candidate division KSB1 bacterium]|nr:long-chain fatty acid--CoA ligase [candidate division KSB1 bacterium]